MPTRVQRKIRRAEKREGWEEHWASRSKYASKKFEEKHGRPPNPKAYSEARKKS